MSQKDIDALVSLRAILVSERRAGAASADAEAVLRIQHQLVQIDAALSDEQALGQREKDELALNRAINRTPDGSNIGAISLVDAPIRVAE